MKIVKRCKWCPVPHLMDERGNPIPGNASNPRVLYSDGMCSLADSLANANLDKWIAEQGKKTVDTKKQ